jgi:hypothetical protein
MSGITFKLANEVAVFSYYFDTVHLHKLVVEELQFYSTQLSRLCGRGGSHITVVQ